MAEATAQAAGGSCKAAASCARAHSKSTVWADPSGLRGRGSDRRAYLDFYTASDRALISLDYGGNIQNVESCLSVYAIGGCSTSAICTISLSEHRCIFCVVPTQQRGHRRISASLCHATKLAGAPSKTRTKEQFSVRLRACKQVAGAEVNSDKSTTRVCAGAQEEAYI